MKIALHFKIFSEMNGIILNFANILISRSLAPSFP